MRKKAIGKIILMTGAILLVGMIGYTGHLHAADSDFPTGDQKGSITIHKFDVDSFENLKTPTGEEADESQIPDGSTAVAGITFTLDKLDDSDGKPVSSSTKKDSSFAQISGTTDSQGTLVFGKDGTGNDTLTKGYYLVSEEVPEGASAQKSQFVVMLPFKINESAEKVSWNYDVHVYPKNMNVELVPPEGIITKELDSKKQVIGLGDELTWSINYVLGSDMKKGDAYATGFSLHDSMDSKQDYKTGSVKFTALDAEGNEVSAVKLVAGTDYTEDYQVHYGSPTGNPRVTWAFADEVVKKLIDNGVVSIQADLVTMVNQNALSAVTFTWNNAGVTFTQEPGDPYTVEVFPEPGEGEDPDPNNPNVPRAYIGSITIDKYEEGNQGTKLEGVSFKIAATKSDAEKGSFIQRDGKDCEVSTDKNGAAQFRALGEGVYYLVETKTADGYQILKDPIEVTIGNEASSANVVVSVPNPKIDGAGGGTGGGTIQKVVSSVTKSVKTGDPTTISMLLGVLVITLAVIFFVVYRRREQKN